MNQDVEKLREFLCKTDYEGGIGEMVGYGMPDDTGDEQLNVITKQLVEVHTAYCARVSELEQIFGDKLYSGEEE